jgi:hypothetical protein
MGFRVMNAPKNPRVVWLGGGLLFFGGLTCLNFALELGPQFPVRAFALVILSLFFTLAGLWVFLFWASGGSARLSVTPQHGIKQTLAVLLLFAIFVLNYLAVGMRMDVYPFYSVRMFNWLGPETEFPQRYYVEKYGYEDKGRVKVVDLRREGSWLYQDFLPWTFGHSASFSSTFHNRAKTENLGFLERETELDLFVVVQKVDLSTGEVSLVEEFCAYHDLRDEIPHYYGPLAVPAWQSEECEQ